MTADGANAARTGSLQGRLARLGFADAARGVRLLSDPGLVGLDDAAVDDLGLAPDPDLALTTLSRVAETRALGADAFVAAIDSDARMRERAYAVLGTSAALGDHLVRHPEDWVVLRGADPDLDDVPPAFAPLKPCAKTTPRPTSHWSERNPGNPTRAWPSPTSSVVPSTMGVRASAARCSIFKPTAFATSMAGR